MSRLIGDRGLMTDIFVDELARKNMGFTTAFDLFSAASPHGQTVIQVVVLELHGHKVAYRLVGLRYCEAWQLGSMQDVVTLALFYQGHPEYL